MTSNKSKWLIAINEWNTKRSPFYSLSPYSGNPLAWEFVVAHRELSLGGISQLAPAAWTDHVWLLDGTEAIKAELCTVEKMCFLQLK